MKNYLDLLEHIINNGEAKSDRTGTGTKSVFGYQMRFDLQKGFPMVTTKKVPFRLIAHELLWFLQGNTNIKYLVDNNVHIWDEWATSSGDLGPIYGKQWVEWESPNGETINQIEQVVEMIKTNPNSRRIIVTAWNPADLPDESVSPQENVENGKMALATCHSFFQFYVANGKLSCQLYQRSADVFLGVPFNIASYSLLVHMIAQQCDLKVGEFIWTGGDVHLYNNTIEQSKIQISREPLPLPALKINRKPDSIFDYKIEDFELVGYQSHPHIKAEISV